MNYAKTLRNKLLLHSETDLVDIKKDMDELLKLADKSSDKYDELKEEIADLEADLYEGATSESETKNWGLLGKQIEEAFEECMTSSKVNQIKLLELLENTAKYGIQYA